MRRATRFQLFLRRTEDDEYQVVHEGRVVYRSTSDTLADAHFELLRDEMQDATGEDPMARIRAEQAFRDIVSVRGEASARRTATEKNRGGKGGRGGT